MTNVRKIPVLRFALAAALIAPAACAPGSASSSRGTRTPAPAGAIAQTCPDSSDGPSIVVDAVETAHRAIAANPATTPPPVCLVAAVAQLQTVADSTREHTLAVAAAIGRRGTAPAELLASEMILLSGLERYDDVSRTYERLVAVDSAPAFDVVRVALGAAHVRADTVALTRIITKTATRSGAPPAFRTEGEVLRNVGRLWTAVNQAGSILRQYPSTVNQYPAIVANFATLALPDSVALYARRGLANGATRTTLTPSIESFVSTMQRQAFLYGSGYKWEQALAGVTRVDSAMSIPSTKFLMASFTVQFVAPMVSEAGGDVGSKDAARHTAACQTMTRASSTLDAADANLRAAGNRPTADAVSSLGAALRATRAQIATASARC
ncbi:MAG TPA: hypothetical protein VJR92_12920 [Gemmatimonadaceae bacterium]|nr:hypothetical protein [Gemmatimonadaceae bacterium]